ncbi:efflux RND transporter permease subunit [Hymenobacter sp.]|uniref:efflux RND transporter permease subunit n=1 Tax=Hymenobacter sp. TaxID=1898978 RepID=UPI00286C10C1|nr:efflux RND transporter permease subunit [Hymenobacter sp.]
MRHFIEFFVTNRSFTRILFVALLAAGLQSLLTMPRGEDPEVNFPTFTVVAVYPGASPADLEDQVVQPLEKRFNELENVKKINSTADDGLAVVQVEYDFSVSPDDKYQEMVREVNAARPELPASLQNLEVKRFQSSDVNVYQYVLLGPNASYQELERWAEKLQDRLEQRVSGFKTVKTWGYPQREVRVSLHLEKLAQQRIPPAAVLGALQSENLSIPGGSVEVGSRRFNLKTSGDLRTLGEIENVVVYAQGGKIIQLRDVADVRFAYEEARHITRLDGVRGVLVTATQKPGQNIFNLEKQAGPVVAAFQKTLPANIRLVTTFDQAASVGQRLSRLGKDFGLAILLVSLTLLPLGWRAALVVMISIPLSLSIGLFLLNALGFTINQLSIVGLIVALGILVDDAIVVVENIERLLRTGLSRTRAVVEATTQLALPVIGVTVTLIIAFVPLLRLPAGPGAFIRGLPTAVVTAVAASLLVSLTIVPFLATVLLRASHNPAGNVFLRALRRGVDATYGRLMHWALGHPRLALAAAFGLVALGLGLAVPRMGFSLFPKAEKPQFLVNVEMPNSAGLPETDRVTRDVERVLARHPDIIHYTTNVGRGQPSIYYNVPQRNEQPNFAQIFVQCRAETYEEKNALVQRLRRELATYPNARVEVKDFEQGPPLEAPVAVRLFGDNLDTLRRLAGQVERELRQVPGTIYLYNPVATRATDLKVVVNQEKAGLLGVATADIDRTVRLAVAGLPAAALTLGDGQDKLPVNVTLARAGGFQQLAVLDRLYVPAATGRVVPLRDVADVRFETAAPAIRHLDQARYTTVNAFAQDGYLYATLQKAAQERLDKLKFPAGYSYKMAGEQENKDDALEGFGTTILLSAFAFVLVLVLEFGSFKSTLIVLSVVPLGAVGGVLALHGAGYPFSFTAIIGFVALIGIEIKNSILLVDYTNQLRAQGQPLEQAIEEAGETRFIPILMTTLTAIGGLIPLILEPAPLYTPLAWVLVGGLSSSLLLSRIVTPVLYKLFPPEVAVAASATPALETAVA